MRNIEEEYTAITKQKKKYKDPNGFMKSGDSSKRLSLRDSTHAMNFESTYTAFFRLFYTLASSGIRIYTLLPRNSNWLPCFDVDLPYYYVNLLMSSYQIRVQRHSSPRALTAKSTSPGHQQLSLE